MKYLIINADDFGYSEVFNESILDLIRNDLISSTTVMVNWITDEQKNQVQELINLQKNHKINIGLHLEFKDSNFENQIKNQFDRFIKIFRFSPSHIDVHKPTRINEEHQTVQKFCKEQNLPCRNLNVQVEEVSMTTNKVLNGTDLTFENLENIIKNLRDNETYEISFHPGTYDKNCKSSLNKQREEDIKKINMINPKLSENQIKLISYNDLVKLNIY